LVKALYALFIRAFQLLDALRSVEKAGNVLVNRPGSDSKSICYNVEKGDEKADNRKD
jgi:hypothetical protein